MEFIKSVCEKLSSMRLSDDSTVISTSVSIDMETNETLETSGPDNPDEPVNEPSNTWEDTGADHWGSSESTETPEYVDSRTQLQKVRDEVEENWNSRSETSRYTRVIVLLLSWEEHDLHDTLDEAQGQFKATFEHLYKYEVRPFKIPMKKPHLALTKKLVDLANADSPDNLFIVWYDGHGTEHEDQRGSPRWCSHGDDKASMVDSAIISTTLADCEADILLVNNACCSLTCGRFSSKGIVESISASAFNTSTYGSSKPDDLSLSMSWAALRILRDRKSVEEGITVAELHRQICLAVQWAGRDLPDYDDINIDSPIFWKAREIRTQPVYTRLSVEQVAPHGRTRSIVLRQLKDDIWGRDFGVIRPELQLQLQVIDLDKMDIKKWTDWLLSAPPDVLGILLEEPRSEENQNKEAENEEAENEDHNNWT